MMIVIRNILVPIDGSEYAFNAAQYAARIARNEKVQLFCTHTTPAASSKESQNYEDIIHKVESGFDIPTLVLIEKIVKVRKELHSIWEPIKIAIFLF
jgi:hypothetical protein